MEGFTWEGCEACAGWREALAAAELDDFFLCKHTTTNNHTLHWVRNCLFACVIVAFYCGSSTVEPGHSEVVKNSQFFVTSGFLLQAGLGLRLA